MTRLDLLERTPPGSSNKDMLLLYLQIGSLVKSTSSCTTNQSVKCVENYISVYIKAAGGALYFRAGLH